jgi:tetratricopeptide (TPR) repeat protein
MQISRIALGAALALGAVSVGAASPALAQKRQQAAQPVPQTPFNLTKEEHQALAVVEKAAMASDWAAATAALPAARAVVTTPGGRFMAGTMLLRIGLGTENLQIQEQAIDEMIASGAAPSDDLPRLYSNQASLAVQLRNHQKAEAALMRLVELRPNDPSVLADLSKVKYDLKKPQEAMSYMTRGIEALRTSGQAVPESWYQRSLAIAYDNKMRAESLAASRALLAAFPSEQNWRSALLVYRDLNQLDKEATLDLYRLMRAAQALHGEADVHMFAFEAQNSGLPGEAKAVLDEAVAKNVVDPNKANFRDLIAAANRRTAGDKAELPALERQALAAANGRDALSIGNALFGYGEYARAAALYRTAVEKGGVDANVAHTRLGMALALAGQRAEAEAALRAVSGQRAELASLWLTWLAHRG